MDYTISERLKNAWNAFINRGPTYVPSYSEPGFFYRPDVNRYSFGNERSIIYSVYNRIAVDVASVSIRHVRVNENDEFEENINSTLDNILTLDANMDQTGRALIQDAVMSLFDEGCIAIVPVDTNISPIRRDSFEILNLRVGKIVQWYPSQVAVNLYNERSGQKEQVIVPKHMCAIVQNPFYAVMNEPNSTSKRLIYKLNLLDKMDEQASGGKLDMIIQLPYTLKNETRIEQAERRRKDIEVQLSSSKYGIAYIDGTEKVIQLNRAVENNLLPQIDTLTKQLYSQLGITEEILNGTATEAVMTNYYNRTVEPVLAAICDEMSRKFLTKTARTQGQKIRYFMNPLKLATTEELTRLGEAFIRSEILTPNEMRGYMGLKPSDDPEANELRNRNLNKPEESMMDDPYAYPGMEYVDQDYENGTGVPPGQQYY